MPLALRLIWDIDGVVDVVNRLGGTWPRPHATRRRGPRHAALFALCPKVRD